MNDKRLLPNERDKTFSGILHRVKEDVIKKKKYLI